MFIEGMACTDEIGAEGEVPVSSFMITVTFFLLCTAPTFFKNDNNDNFYIEINQIQLKLIIEAYWILRFKIKIHLRQLCVREILVSELIEAEIVTAV